MVSLEVSLEGGDGEGEILAPCRRDRGRGGARGGARRSSRGGPRSGGRGMV